jgi:hypothetical protein
MTLAIGPGSAAFVVLSPRNPLWAIAGGSALGSAGLHPR